MKSLADIYFYNAMGLATNLRDGTVSETRALKHLIAVIILGGIGFEVPVSVDFQTAASGPPGHFLGYILVLTITSVISYYGVWLAHQVNTKGDGKDFFLRFSALSLPIGIQLVVLFLGIGLVLALFAIPLTSALGEWGMYVSLASFYVAGVTFTGMFFLRMHKYIAVASGAHDQKIA